MPEASRPKIPIWPFVAISFAILLLLVPLFVWIVARKADQIDRDANLARQAFQQADDSIADIQQAVYRMALLLRLPAGHQNKLTIAAVHWPTEEQLTTLSSLLGPTQQPKVDRLRNELRKYHNSALEDRSQQRETVLDLVEQIDQLNTANLRLEEKQIATEQQGLRRFATGATLIFVCLGITVAVACTIYLARLERASDLDRRRAETAGNELRRLSNQLVGAQEEERKVISRELHDEVGQILTGLRMELGSLSPTDPDAGFRERLNSVKALAEEALRSVRNLSLLLRPSMLDDLGLGPALRWQAKEFSRRSGIAVSTELQPGIDSLPEDLRICLYRTIQEALTNCAKHAQSTRVQVTVAQTDDLVSASVQDNGKGFEPGQIRERGLGLVGMEERVRALRGKLAIHSKNGSGTLITIQLPMMAGLRETDDLR